MNEPRGPGRPPGASSISPEESPRSRLRFPKARHLRRRRDFVRVQDRSARVTTPHFVLLVAPRPIAAGSGSLPDSGAPRSASVVPCRLGIVASKKVGNAVVRNRTKRLVREAFRTRPELFPRDVDLVVIARQGPSGLSLSSVCREIEGVAPLLARRAREALRAAAGGPSHAAPGHRGAVTSSGK